MNPHDFIAKWRSATLKERSGSQSHFNDLCALLGVADPATADPTGEWFAFEKGTTKSGGAIGWADVWRRGCFAWEYKGPGKSLDNALNQLLQYRGQLENPPLLIVSDMDRICVHTNWNNTVQEVHEFPLNRMVDADTRDRLKRIFTDPEAFKPSKTRQALTEEAAGEFAAIAKRLRDRGHQADEVAHFVNRLAFCMFAEDVALLPDHLFTKMLEHSRSRDGVFEDNARKLFAAMAQPNGSVGFDPVDWFNGGLFEDDQALPLTTADVKDLLKAARRDWSAIDPSILGTLFERGLDPDKRSQLGAHYTDHAKIMMIVQPVIIDPLEAEWRANWDAASGEFARAEHNAEQTIAKASARADLADEIMALRASFRDPRQLELFEGLSGQKRVRELDAIRAGLREASRNMQAARAAAKQVRDEYLLRLRNFRVLDPACGSGNFLYVALTALKDIEHRVNIDAEQFGIERSAPEVGPEAVLGIELNPYAAELARVSVWIGEIQWMRRNGFAAARNPILRPLNTIECRDAVLNKDGTRAEWPAADVVVGNPPFLGASRMIGGLGEQYTEDLRHAWAGVVPGFGDLVTFWFAKAWQMISAGKVERAGLVATNSIRGGTNREVLKAITNHGTIFNAWSDQPWTVEGAAVRVSVVCFSKSALSVRLDGYEVRRILPDLSANNLHFDLTLASQLSENDGVAAYGSQQKGSFGITAELARQILVSPNPHNKPNRDVVRRSINALQVARRMSDAWTIDFGLSMTESDAALYELPFEIAKKQVLPERAARRDSGQLKRWWLHARPSPVYRRMASKLARYIASPAVAKHRLFVWLSPEELADHALLVFARDDDTSFGILHSRFHELWSLRMGTFLGVGNDPRYTPSTTFETFPFPAGLTPNIPAAAYADDPRAQAIAVAAARLNELRENWLNPEDLVMRVPEVVPGYPDRILPRDEAAAKELKKRTLTNLYNARPQWLLNAHAALDAAVADAYGWGADWRAGSLTDDEILARLFRLNQARATGG